MDRQRKTAAGGSFVTVVSGPPRSGTSMMMQMLEAGGIPALTDNLRRPDEDNLRGYYEFEPVKNTRKDPSWVEGASGKAVKVIYRLLRDLPAQHRYRVIFMQRELAEVVASQNKMLRRQGKAGGALSDDRLVALFRAQLAEVQDWLAGQDAFAVLTVRYGEVLADPSGQAERVSRFLGGGLDVAAMARVVDPALYRNRC